MQYLFLFSVLITPKHLKRLKHKNKKIKILELKLPNLNCVRRFEKEYISLPDYKFIRIYCTKAKVQILPTSPGSKNQKLKNLIWLNS